MFLKILTLIDKSLLSNFVEITKLLTDIATSYTVMYLVKVFGISTMFQEVSVLTKCVFFVNFLMT